MPIIFIRAVIIYCVLILSVRLMGKRQIGELQPSELAITILISNIATLPVEDVSIPLMTGLLPLLTLVCLDVIMSWLAMKYRKVRSVTSGNPMVIISGGVIDQKAMKELRFTVDDLMEALHGQNIFDVSQVRYAVVETTGKVSVYPKYEYRGITNADMKLNSKSYDPPELIISDGIISDNALTAANLSRGNIETELKKHALSAEDVYIMTYSYDSKKYNIIPMQESSRKAGKK